MDAASALAKGLVIGISIAAPVGPIGLLCIRRTLAGGVGPGLASGLGAASADALYGAVAAFGLAAVSDLLASHEAALRLAGGLFLLWLGASTAFARPAAEGEGRATGPAARGGTAGALGAFLSTAALTAANPSTILSFVAVFGALGLGAAAGASAGGAGAEGQGAGAAAAMVAGVFLGSALWWLFLSLGVSAARERVGPRAMAWINRASGAVLAAFGVAALAGLIA